MDKKTLDEQYPEQWRGCIACRQTHHETNFCACGRCLFHAKQATMDFYVVECWCGKVLIWA